MVYGLGPANSVPFHVRSDQQSGLLSDGALAGCEGTRRDFVFVINPRGANGRTGREWKRLLPQLRSRFSKGCNICESFTSRPLHAVDITREAIKRGAEAVIAVGGDGTLHEVVNGFFDSGNPLLSYRQGAKHSTTLGLIPLGTGSDFARTFCWKNNPYDAIECIAKGEKSKVDVGVIDGQHVEPHYFINVADIHLSAKAGYYASKYKRFGNLCYVIGALRAFIGHSNRDFRIKVNGGDWEEIDKVTAICLGNAKFFGGGMKITPTADPSSGSLEVVTLQDFKWYDFIFKLHKLYNGSHISEKNVHLRSVHSLEIEEKAHTGCVYIQSDGEHLGFLPRRISILRGAIEMFC